MKHRIFIQKCYQKYSGIGPENPSRLKRIEEQIHTLEKVDYNEEEAKNYILEVHSEEYFADFVKKCESREKFGKI